MRETPDEDECAQPLRGRREQSLFEQTLDHEPRGQHVGQGLGESKFKRAHATFNLQILVENI